MGPRTLESTLGQSADPRLAIRLIQNMELEGSHQQLPLHRHVLVTILMNPCVIAANPALRGDPSLRSSREDQTITYVIRTRLSPLARPSVGILGAPCSPRPASLAQRKLPWCYFSHLTSDCRRLDQSSSSPIEATAATSSTEGRVSCLDCAGHGR